MFDIYFEPDYAKLYESVENGKAMLFEHQSNYGKVHHLFIKREIPIKLNNKTYYDIVTPYGYGGPLFIDSKDHKLLASEFNLVFESYCKSNNIVSEFVRFHPIIENNVYLDQVYNISKIRKTVGTNLEYDNPFQEEFSKSTRKTIRRVLKSGVKFDVIEAPDNLSTFMEIYYSTMDRNNAVDYYYFDTQYFKNCLSLFKDNIVLVNIKLDDKVIASSLNFKGTDSIHVHLSGTLSEYLSYSPAYITKYATLLWAKENNYKIIHYGGGTSNDENDPLYQFKKKFGKNTEFEFNIGKKIWNKEVYSALCKIKGVNEHIEFFPAYRYECE